MGERVQHFLTVLPQLTQTEADMIKEILHWQDEDKAAFLLAKQIFEEDDRQKKLP